MSDLGVQQNGNPAEWPSVQEKAHGMIAHGGGVPDMKALLKMLLLVAIFLSACGGFELTPQPQAGEGWEFLAWAPSRGDIIDASDVRVLTTQTELDELVATLRPDFATADELERVGEGRTPRLAVDFDNEVVLALGSDAVGNCGGPVYLDISFTETQVVMDPFRVPPDTTCTTAARRSVSLFALDRTMLPSSPFGVVVSESNPETVINLDS